MSDRLDLPQKPNDLNDAQWAAVLDKSKYLLITAGPGTGKTHTLTHRIENFIGRLKDSQQILAVTFTNKAARQMQQRLIRGIDNVENFVVCTTFHGFCLKILKEYFPCNLPADFMVASQQQIEDLSQKLWPAVSTKQRREYLQEISLRKAKNFSLSLLPQAEQYNSAMRQNGWLDFDDLLLMSVEFLTSQSLVAQKLRQQYPFIFVDEYQDINPIQQRLLQIIVGESGHLTAIGDPNQAIYGFRGSDVKYFMTFAEDFKGATKLTLSENYRSAQNLLSASSQILSDKTDFFLPLQTAKMYLEGRLVIAQTPTDKAEAEYVVHKIEEIVGGTSLFSKDSGRVGHDDKTLFSFGDIAIVFRLNSQRSLFEQALDRSGIPYQISQEKTYDDPQELLTKSFKHIHSEDQKAEKVSLLTLHAAKGLEFAVVFIVGCENNLLPLDLPSMTADPQEERRLFYVGVTRAKQQLYLVSAARRRLYGQIYQSAPSIFLTDIKEELKEYDKTQSKNLAKRKDDQMMLFS